MSDNRSLTDIIDSGDSPNNKISKEQAAELSKNREKALNVGTVKMQHAMIFTDNPYACLFNRFFQNKDCSIDEILENPKRLFEEPYSKEQVVVDSGCTSRFFERGKIYFVEPVEALYLIGPDNNNTRVENDGSGLVYISSDDNKLINAINYYQDGGKLNKSDMAMVEEALTKAREASKKRTIKKMKDLYNIFYRSRNLMRENGLDERAVHVSDKHLLVSHFLSDAIKKGNEKRQKLMRNFMMNQKIIDGEM